MKIEKIKNEGDMKGKKYEIVYWKTEDTKVRPDVTPGMIAGLSLPGAWVGRQWFNKHGIETTY